MLIYLFAIFDSCSTWWIFITLTVEGQGLETCSVVMLKLVKFFWNSSHSSCDILFTWDFRDGYVTWIVLAYAAPHSRTLFYFLLKSSVVSCCLHGPCLGAVFILSWLTDHPFLGGISLYSLFAFHPVSGCLWVLSRSLSAWVISSWLWLRMVALVCWCCVHFSLISCSALFSCLFRFDWGYGAYRAIELWWWCYLGPSVIVSFMQLAVPHHIGPSTRRSYRPDGICMGRLMSNVRIVVSRIHLVFRFV